MEKEEKLKIVKPIIVKVLMEIQKNFPWLDYDMLMIGRDSSLSGDTTIVRLLFQRCTDSEGNVPTGVFGWRKAKYYDEITNLVWKVLKTRLEGTPRLLSIDSGTYSHIQDVPGFVDPDDGSYYGVALQIDFRD